MTSTLNDDQAGQAAAMSARESLSLTGANSTPIAPIRSRHPQAPVFSPPYQPAPDLQIVVPVLNEEGRVGPTIDALCSHLAGQPWSAALIVVDNGSADGTSEVVDQAQGGRIAVEVIGCRRRGKGAAVRAGVLYSTARWVGFCDADLATSPATVDGAVELLAEGWDVVIGSRYCPGARTLVRQPPLRRAGSAVFRALARRMGVPVSDTQCGFKFFDGAHARALFAQARLEGFAFDIEILSKAHRAGLSIAELPVDWSNREGSTLRPVADGLHALRELREMRRRQITERA
ncbi:MAG TPA: glycosyltransferase [Acidimicrobiales bacterium]|nr:glycosyltransferase [Acidimicrobiales bacterium]